MNTLRGDGGTPLKDLLLVAADDPNHPEHKLYKALGPQLIERCNAIEEAEKEANKFLTLITDRLVVGIEKHPPLSAEAVLFIIGKTTEEIRKEAEKIISNRQSEYARRPRPGRQHEKKPEIYGYWKEWQAKPSLYKSKAAFIRDMQEKTGIDRAKTIEEWIKEWRLTG